MACFFFFNDTATTEIYTLSLHDALPISERAGVRARVEEDRRAVHGQLRSEALPQHRRRGARGVGGGVHRRLPDRKSTRLNSSHSQISYAVFCLKKKIQMRDLNVALHSAA